MGNPQFPPSEVEIRLENDKNTANTLGAFFWSFFFDFTSFFPGGLLPVSQVSKALLFKNACGSTFPEQIPTTVCQYGSTYESVLLKCYSKELLRYSVVLVSQRRHLVYSIGAPSAAAGAPAAGAAAAPRYASISASKSSAVGGASFA